MFVYDTFLRGYGAAEARYAAISAATFLAWYALTRTWSEARFKTEGVAVAANGEHDGKAASGQAPPALRLRSASDASQTQRERSKARSWLLSLLVSAVMSVAGALYAYMVVGTWVTEGTFAATEIMLSNSAPFARQLVVFFETFCVCDLAIGLVDYRDQIRVDTGYVHHTAYIVLCSLMLSLDIATSLTVFGLCEVPTFMLALGSIKKAWRLDLPMGVTFFAFRIIYMAAILGLLALAGYVWQPITGLPLLALHVVWFLDWTVSYKMVLQRAAQGGKVESQQFAAGAHHPVRNALTGMSTPGLGSPTLGVPPAASSPAQASPAETRSGKGSPAAPRSAKKRE